MWHKLFRSKSTKIGNGSSTNGVTAQDDHDDTGQLPQVLRLKHNNVGDYEDAQLTTNIATVRKHKNKLSNPFKRSGGSNRNAGDSSSKRQCSGSSSASNIGTGTSANCNGISKVVNVYESMNQNQSAPFLQSSLPYTLSSTTAVTGITTAKDSSCHKTNLGISIGLNPIEHGTVPVNDRQLKTFTTFNGYNSSSSGHNVTDDNDTPILIVEDNRKIRAAGNV